MHIRIARHTTSLQPVIDFYTKLLSCEVLGDFQNHDNYNGVFIGIPGENWHLEFTVSNEKPVHVADEDDLLVFYGDNYKAYTELVKKAKLMNIPEVEPKNPYWATNGTTLLDPDGFRVVLTYKKTVQSSKISEEQELQQVITDYSYALDVLDKYDHQNLTIEAVHTQQSFVATYDTAMSAIGALKAKFGGTHLFANEKDESFQGALAALYQTFDGEELYPSIEEKAASFLYFVVKNHSFSDGNKRIAAFLFVWFMMKNNLLYREDGSKRIADNTLVALTLMIAESRPEEKDIIIQVVVNLINANNK